MDKIKIIQDSSLGIEVIHSVSLWMKRSGLNTEYWEPNYMNSQYLFKYSEPDEYYVALLDDTPVASVILQETERNQSWKSVDENNPKKALYIHWLCVKRKFTGQGLSKKMIEFAEKEARKRGFKRLRLDTYVDEPKLCSLYKSLGFKVVGTDKDDSNIIFFEKRIL